MSDLSSIQKEFDKIFSTIAPQLETETTTENMEEVEDFLQGVSNTIDHLESSAESIGEGDYVEATRHLGEAGDSTFCASCKKQIERAKIDIEYVSRICKLDDDDCDEGVKKAKDKVEDIANKLREELDNIKEEIKDAG